MSKAHKFGDNVDTDIILPGKYLSISDATELGKVCMSGIDPDFSQKVHAGDIIVAGSNFGCGSSREHAPISILAAGIHCVIAESFARIFYRNAINLGLLVLEAPQAAAETADRDEVEVAVADGIIRNVTTGKEYRFTPFSPAIMDIISHGGIKNKIRSELRAQR